MSKVAFARVVVVASFLLALSAPTVSPAQPTDAVRSEARTRFQKGLESFEEGRYEAALAEFQKAYDVLPSYRVLYNLGKVHALLGHSVKAADAYQRYLSEGAAAIRPERRNEVAGEIKRLKGRIGRVWVKVNTSSALVTLDGVEVARAPLSEPLRVDAGSHTVGAKASGYIPGRKAIQVAGNSEQTVVLTLEATQPQRANLTITAALDGVEIEVDGQSHGLTPLPASIALEPGKHRIVASRRGYQTHEETVELEPGTTFDLPLNLTRDLNAPASDLGTLRLGLQKVPFEVRVDGKRLQPVAGTLVLPVGKHDIVLNVAERLPYQGEVDIVAQQTQDLSPVLTWTPDARQKRVDSARTRRTWGWVLAGSGALIGAGGTILFLQKDAERDELDEDLQSLSDRLNTDECQRSEASICFDPVSNQVVKKGEARDSANQLRTLGLVSAGVGFAALATGAVLLVSAPSDTAIDRGASAGVRRRFKWSASYNWVQLDGTF